MTPAADDAPDEAAAGAARSLFRYLGGDEWREYRAILAVFAGTFFAEFTPDEIATAVAPAGVDPGVVPDRLERLRQWGNLTVSSSVGNPTSLDDYYRRRNRYLITRPGQEVFDAVERLLAGADEVGDVQAGRLRDLHRHLLSVAAAAELGFAGPADQLVDAVRAAFDVHERFTTELTQFFAELNQWQSRYDLAADEVQFLASVLVDYVGEQLTEIERMSRPIARVLDRVLPSVPRLIESVSTGLAARVDAAGLTDRVTVRHQPGTRADDWDHLAMWFTATPGRPARLDQLTRQALAAVRTLTANLTRLSRIGLAATSRRTDFVRLASYFHTATSIDDAHRIATAALGLGGSRHLSTLSADADDPVPTNTPWAVAPRACVPISLRERGDTTQRGRASPIRDRSSERELLRRRRDHERLATERVADEVLAWAASTTGGEQAKLSMPAFVALRDLVGRASAMGASGTGPRVATGLLDLHLELQRAPGRRTIVACPDGRLVLIDLVVSVRRRSGHEALAVAT
jgi:uncharacterized protein (TIGR02677 family)